ncbi:PilN domain-containing protein [Aliikangiella sp. G2MR2-5]|uniref:PilN domain-containing protein n=1 Tax=Aliikangiella sp. G2MR2-5 TaxID=2788943 RepID=UPI0018A9C33E|nr:PilN domain-containing protein [Aliikangiella sp. G2MR2-5]
MANINLLPWREEQRQERQRQFVSVLGLVALFGVVLMWGVYTFYNSLLDDQRERNRFLQTEIRKLDSKIKEIQQLEKERQQLVERMTLIQDLQKSRPQVVHVFDEIVTNIPQGVNLSLVSRKGDDLVFTGIAESAPRISKFMRNISQSTWLKPGPLDNIQGDKNSGANRKKFTLRTKISAPDSAEKEAK